MVKWSPYIKRKLPFNITMCTLKSTLQETVTDWWEIKHFSLPQMAFLNQIPTSIKPRLPSSSPMKAHIIKSTTNWWSKWWMIISLYGLLRQKRNRKIYTRTNTVHVSLSAFTSIVKHHCSHNLAWSLPHHQGKPSGLPRNIFVIASTLTHQKCDQYEKKISKAHHIC